MCRQSDVQLVHRSLTMVAIKEEQVRVHATHSDDDQSVNVHSTSTVHIGLSNADYIDARHW